MSKYDEKYKNIKLALEKNQNDGKAWGELEQLIEDWRNDLLAGGGENYREACEMIKKRDVDFELRAERVKTGTPKIDDLLMGGIPLRSAVLVSCPPFIGGEVLCNSFVAEGIKKGIPSIVILTISDPKQFRDDLEFHTTGSDERNIEALVKYVDGYSSMLGDKTSFNNTKTIDVTKELDTLMSTIDEMAKELKDKHPYYRLLFMSLTPILTYHDIRYVYKFLLSFIGKRKKENAVCLFHVGMDPFFAKESELINALMDGDFDLKTDQTKTFIRVRAVCEVQTREYVEYNFSKMGLYLKPFSIHHMK